RGVLALEEQGGDLGEFVGAVLEAGVPVLVEALQVVHDGQRVPLVRAGEPDGVGDPDTDRAGILFPAVLVAGMVPGPGPPHAPLLVEGADVLEPVDEIVPDSGGGPG